MVAKRLEWTQFIVNHGIQIEPNFEPICLLPSSSSTLRPNRAFQSASRDGFVSDPTSAQLINDVKVKGVMRLMNTLNISACALCETWIRSRQQDKQMQLIAEEEGYRWFAKRRTKQHHRAKRGCGGVGWLIAKEAAEAIT